MLNKTQIKELEELCYDYDLDPQAYDFDAIDDYYTLREMILKDACAETEETEEMMLNEWDAVNEYYNNLSYEEKTAILDEPEKVDIPNCLVLQFSHRQFRFAADLLYTMFKGNMMLKTKKDIENKTLRYHRTLWFVGNRRTTDLILEELKKRNLKPKILRNMYLKRRFVHYCKGKIVKVSQKEFNQQVKPLLRAK